MGIIYSIWPTIPVDSEILQLEVAEYILSPYTKDRDWISPMKKFTHIKSLGVTLAEDYIRTMSFNALHKAKVKFRIDDNFQPSFRITTGTRVVYKRNVQLRGNCVGMEFINKNGVEKHVAYIIWDSPAPTWWDLLFPTAVKRVPKNICELWSERGYYANFLANEILDRTKVPAIPAPSTNPSVFEAPVVCNEHPCRQDVDENPDPAKSRRSSDILQNTAHSISIGLVTFHESPLDVQIVERIKADHISVEIEPFPSISLNMDDLTLAVVGTVDTKDPSLEPNEIHQEDLPVGQNNEIDHENRAKILSRRAQGRNLGSGKLRIPCKDEPRNPTDMQVTVSGKVGKCNKKARRKTLAVKKATELKRMVGYGKGIQGRNNSCYADAFLFATFYPSSIFDELFLVPKPLEDDDAGECRNLLKNIASPLRKNFFCSHEVVKPLRHFLSRFEPRVNGAMMDVEELLYLLLEDILKEKPILRYTSGVQDYMHAIKFDIDKVGEMSKYSTVKDCLKLSFNYNRIQLESVPSPAFFVQLPREAGKLVHFSGILPDIQLEIGSLLTSVECTKCQSVESVWEIDTGFDGICYVCNSCVTGCVPGQTKLKSRAVMDLLAVICLRSYHYTCFVKSKTLGEWLYFDSMACGGPSITVATDLEKQIVDLIQNPGKRANLCPSSVPRIVADATVCIYEPRWVSHHDALKKR